MTLIVLAASPHAQVPAAQTTVAGRVGASKRPLLSAATDATDATGAHIVISLPTGAVVTGTVIDHLGQPQAGLYLNISGSALPSLQVSTTNRVGEYRFFSLPSGDYTIGVVGRKGEGRTVSVGAGEHKQLTPLLVEPAEPTPMPGRAVTKGNNVVAGVAVDERSGEPLVNAPVISRGFGLRSMTDANGRFRFEDLGDGTYSFLVEGREFQPTSAAEVTVKDGARIIDLTLRGGRNGSIGGIVRDEVGDPVVNMPVVAYHKLLMGFQPILIERGGVRTDDRGMFDIRNLPPSDYLLCACAGDSLAIDPGLLRQLDPTAPDAAMVSALIDETVQTFAPTYYPGQAHASNSPLVTVDRGDARMGMDLTMHGVTPFVVEGQLIEGGAPATTRMQVFLSQPGAIGLSGMTPASLSSDGRFRFVGVPPGSYALGAIPATANHRTPWAHTEVTVADRDLVGLVVPIGDGVTVSGRVEFSGSAAAPSATVLETVRVALLPLEFTMSTLASIGNSGTVGDGARIDGSGQFTIGGLPPGRYRVVVTVPNSPWRMVRRVSPSASGTLVDVITVGSEDETGVLVVVSDAPPAVLTGSVVFARYESPGYARAMIFPMDASTWIEPERYPLRFQPIFIRPDGSFRLDTVPPGDYYVARGSSFDAEMSKSALERWAKTAQRVTLRAGETTTVALKKIDEGSLWPLTFGLPINPKTPSPAP